MTNTLELDPELRYLVPVGRLLLEDEPDLVHLSLYDWLPRWNEWATGLALCGTSTEQGALPEGTEVTCEDCKNYRPRYQAALDAQRRRVEGTRRLLEHAKTLPHPGDTAENGAWFTVWLEGDWSWVTSRMTTEQREYAADRAAAYSTFLASCDGELEREEPEGLRWWREGGR